MRVQVTPGAVLLRQNTKQSFMKKNILSPNKRWIFVFALLCLCALSAFAQSSVETYGQLVQAIRETQAANQPPAKQGMVREAWTIGKLIETHVAQHKLWGNYSQEVDQWLARDVHLTLRELQEKRYFARIYPENAPSYDLGWGHYYEMLDVKDAQLREEMAKKAEQGKWPREKLREELKKVLPEKMPEEKSLPSPALGKLNVYPIVKAEDGRRLKIDLGFNMDLNVPEGSNLQEGDFVSPAAAGRGPLHALRATQNDLHNYPATVIQVLDGDTLDARVDLGFELTTTQRFRLRGLDAPELGTPEGTAAKAFLVDLMTQNPKVMIRVTDLDKFRRFTAEVWSGGKSINQEILSHGFAVLEPS